MKSSGLPAIVIILACSCGCHADEDKEVSAQETLDQFWAEYKSPKAAAAKPVDYWLNAVPETDVIRSLSSSRDEPRAEVKAAIESLVGRITLTREEDFHAVIHLWDLLDPIKFGRYDKTTANYSDRLIDTFAEAQVRAWQKDPQLLERYVWLLVWTGRFKKYPNRLFWFSNGLFEDDKGPDPSYWKDARAFMILARMSNREDLYKDVPVDKLKEPYKKWHKWLFSKDAVLNLRASALSPTWIADGPSHEDEERPEEFSAPDLLVTPPYPFPDWEKNKLPAPMPPNRFPLGGNEAVLDK